MIRVCATRHSLADQIHLVLYLYIILYYLFYFILFYIYIFFSQNFNAETSYLLDAFYNLMKLVAYVICGSRRHVSNGYSSQHPVENGNIDFAQC